LLIAQDFEQNRPQLVANRLAQLAQVV